MAEEVGADMGKDTLVITRMWPDLEVIIDHLVVLVRVLIDGFPIGVYSYGVSCVSNPQNKS